MDYGIGEPGIHRRLLFLCFKKIYHRRFVDNWISNSKPTNNSDFYFEGLATNSSIADSMEGYKKVKPVAFIFLSLTVALFKISILRFPKMSFKIKCWYVNRDKKFVTHFFAKR